MQTIKDGRPKRLTLFATVVVTALSIAGCADSASGQAAAPSGSTSAIRSASSTSPSSTSPSSDPTTAASPAPTSVASATSQTRSSVRHACQRWGMVEATDSLAVMGGDQVQLGKRVATLGATWAALSSAMITVGTLPHTGLTRQEMTEFQQAESVVHAQCAKAGVQLH